MWQWTAQDPFHALELFPCLFFFLFFSKNSRIWPLQEAHVDLNIYILHVVNADNHGSKGAYCGKLWPKMEFVV